MKLALATDHAGFEQLKWLKEVLEAAGHDCVDYGPGSFDADDDYPGFILAAARAVANDDCERGIIMGGSGQGEAISANRVKGVRCALYYGPARPTGAIDAEGNEATDDYEILRLSREHNDANMLSLAARFLTKEQIENAVRIWLQAPFPGAERHARRIKQIDQLS